nr:GTP-binding protein [Actinomycetales bacterium]
MTARARADVLNLFETARALYGDEPPAELAALEQRMKEPLRLAIAGMVKAGKSTLLNALLGERVAATDAGECTLLVTWYRYSETPSITLYPEIGKAVDLPIRQEHGQVTFEIDRPVEEVARVEVRWPAPALRSVTLIDTPGIGSLSAGTSARSEGFLAPDDAPATADAVIYLMRHLHPADIRFLEVFRDSVAGLSSSVNALAVLSRADEIGSGRIDSLLSARRVAHRYEQDPSLTSLALGVFPVAGLLAEGARTLRKREFTRLQEIAGLEREDREKLLVSADRFVRMAGSATFGEQDRRDLISRFGIFGVRLAATLIRAGATTPPALAEAMVGQSGLEELRTFVERQFVGRTTTLKVHGVVEGFDWLLRKYPLDDPDPLRAGIERLRLRAHGLRELALLSQSRKTGIPLAEGAVDAVRIAGGGGLELHARLGLPATTAEQDVQMRLQEELIRWRRKVNDPANSRPAVEVCETVLRTLEGFAAKA